MQVVYPVCSGIDVRAKIKRIKITGFELYGLDGANPPKHHISGDQAAWDVATTDLGDKDKQAFIFTAKEDPEGPTQVMARKAGAQVFLIVRYSL